MRSDELKRVLSHLHDAELLGLSTDYERNILELRLNLVTSPPVSPHEQEGVTHHPHRMVVSGLQYCVIEPPDNWALLAQGAPYIDSTDEGVPSTTRWAFTVEKSAAVTVWLYVSTWNSFIRFAGTSVELHGPRGVVAPG